MMLQSQLYDIAVTLGRTTVCEGNDSNVRDVKDV
jgi:hypothetical protein